MSTYFFSRKFFLFGVLFFNASFSASQHQVKGNVTEKNGEPAIFVNLLLKTPRDSITIAFSNSDEKGNFTLKNVIEGQYLLQVSGVGFKTKFLQLEISTNRTESIDIILEEQETLLKELIVHGQEPIGIKGDTISLEADAFSNGKERVLEDLLKRLPGLKVDDNGTIKVGDREIEKILVEGDDLFDKGYKILSKNMPSFSIKSIELLRNYSNNLLLKGVERTNKVAINLRLKPSFKNILFGNVSASNGFGNQYRFDNRFNVMNFGKSTKYYLLGNLNNTGYDATGDIDGILHPSYSDENLSIGDTEKIQQLIDLSVHPANFKRERTNFNQTTLLSPSVIINPTPKLKLKATALLFNDNRPFFRKRRDNVTLGSIIFSNEESDSISTSKYTLLGKIEGAYSHSKNTNLESATKFSTSSFKDFSQLRFNSTPLTQSLYTPNQILDQKFLLTKRLSSESVFQLTGRFIFESINQNYQSGSTFLKKAMTELDSTDVVNQIIGNKMMVGGVEARFIKTYGLSKNTIDFKIGNRLRNDGLISKITIPSLGEVVNVKLLSNDFYFSGKAIKSINKLSLIGKLEAHQFYSSVSFRDSISSQIPFFVMPSFGIEWQFSKRSKINSSYSYSRNNIDIVDTYTNSVFTDFRSINKGLGRFTQLASSRLFFNYQSGGWEEKLFINLFALYTYHHDFLTTNSLITKEVVNIEKVLGKNRSDFNSSFNLDFFFKDISSNVKLDLGLTSTSFVNFINGSAFRSVQSSNLRYGVEFRSAFNWAINFHVGTKWMPFFIDVNSQKNSFVDNLSFLDLSFDIGSKLNFRLEAERYNFGNVGTNNVFYFLDFNLQYDVKPNKCVFGVSGRNMFDNTFFNSFLLTDIGNSSFEYPLLPRFILARIEYRF